MIEPLGGENNLHIDADGTGVRFIAALGADESGFLHLGRKARLGIKKAI
jgi:hypothetical protein